MAGGIATTKCRQRDLFTTNSRCGCLGLRVPFVAMKPIILELAPQVGAKPAAIQKWKERGAVPYKWRFALIEAAKKVGKRLTNADMEFRDAA